MRLILTLVAFAFTSVPAMADMPSHDAQAREIYARIIEFRTAEGQAQVPAMVAYLKDVLTKAGVPVADIATLDSGEAQAMLVRVPGRERGRPILFSAHMDVVDARPEDWERSPFTLIEENGVFYGRGTSDNKAGVASMLSTIRSAKACGAITRAAGPKPITHACSSQSSTTLSVRRMRPSASSSIACDACHCRSRT